MSKQDIFMGFVELNYSGGLVRFELYKDTDEGGDYYYSYVNNEIADDAESVEEFVGSYGERIYKTLDDFKIGNFQSVYDYWPREEE